MEKAELDNVIDEILNPPVMQQRQLAEPEPVPEEQEPPVELLPKKRPLQID